MPSSRKRLLSVLFDSGASFEQVVVLFQLIAKAPGLAGIG
jgi:hypothetical protein